MKIDEILKSPKIRFSVIPAKAGIQFFQIVINSLDSGFHRSDDFLRDHQICNLNFAFCPAEAGKGSQFFKGLNCYTFLYFQSTLSVLSYYWRVKSLNFVKEIDLKTNL